MHLMSWGRYLVLRFTTICTALAITPIILQCGRKAAWGKHVRFSASAHFLLWQAKQNTMLSIFFHLWMLIIILVLAMKLSS